MNRYTQVRAQSLQKGSHRKMQKEAWTEHVGIVVHRWLWEGKYLPSHLWQMGQENLREDSKGWTIKEDSKV